MNGWFWWIILAIFFTVVIRMIGSALGEADDDAGDPSPLDKPLNSDTVEDLSHLYRLADGLVEFTDRASHPREMLGERHFIEGVEALLNPAIAANSLTDYVFGGNWIVALMAAEALTRRDDGATQVDRVLGNIGTAAQWPLFFRLRFLSVHAALPVIGAVLRSVQEWWITTPLTVQILNEFVRERTQESAPHHEALSIRQDLEDCTDEQINLITQLVRRFDRDLAQPLDADIAAYQRESVDTRFLRSIGRLWNRHQSMDGSALFMSDRNDQYLSSMLDALTEDPPRSILLAGETGVGKTTLRRQFSGELAKRGWQIVQTSAQGLIADKMYIGEIEGQVRRLAANAAVSKKVAVYIDNLNEMARKGGHDMSPDSVLDQLWGQIEAHELFFVSETTTDQFQVLARRYPNLSVTMKVIRIEPMSDAESRCVAGQVMELMTVVRNAERGQVAVAEAADLADQYLNHKELPGRLIDLLKLAGLRALADETELDRTHLMGALSELTGLPAMILDDREKIEVGRIRDEFRASVVGQDEAVECLVERVTMLKAGLCDPNRPVGTLLFAGPTGTGKTKLAKTLAQILFGSGDKMIRLDMSEYQAIDAAERLLELGDAHRRATSLVNQIREQPFSVVLLDEFEKAHMNVWDVFLQVFDDGRLTDSAGNVADFRHSIIILTSNLGAAISNEAGVGFIGTAGQFSPADVMKTINRTFRKEFINRLDRVVVFNPLSRESMRTILQLELKQALTRRGLRRREWAVEWEDSALEFLLEQGFTPDLGARPLRRAIEHHLLAPLAVRIAEHRAPEGDQFMFIRSDGTSLQVEFVDPDADEDIPTPDRVASVREPTDLSVEHVMLHPNGGTDERRFLIEAVDSVVTRVGCGEWQSAKDALLQRVNREGFWDRPDRAAVFERFELIDRIQVATEVLRPLAERLRGPRSGSALCRRVAEKLYVLQEGLRDFDDKRPTQALLGIRIVAEDRRGERSREFQANLAGMYRNWARMRRMRFRELTPASGDGSSTVFSFGGFGCFGILKSEEGLHVLEVPRGENSFDRIRARVVVTPGTFNDDSAARQKLERARSALNAADDNVSTIVRRYREAPSPLVRDAREGWRTGRIEQIWKGNFDVWGAAS